MKLASATTVAAELGVKLTLVLPAALGGLIALYFFDGKTLPDGTIQPASPATKAAVVLGGTGLGLFCGPLAVEAFNLTDKSGRLEMGFAILIAALGMAIVANLLKAIRDVKWGDVLASWITRRT